MYTLLNEKLLAVSNNLCKFYDVWLKKDIKKNQIKAMPLSFLNKVVLFQKNKDYCLDMFGTVVVAVAGWNHNLKIDFHSSVNINLMCLFSHNLSFICLFEFLNFI